MRKTRMRLVSVIILAAGLGVPIVAEAAGEPSKTAVVTFSKVGYLDNDTFDFLLESLLSGKRERIAILTGNAYDGVSVPELDGRLQSWLWLWLDANRKKRDGMQLLGKLPSGSVKAMSPRLGSGGIEIGFDVAGFDPHQTTETILTTVERWAKDGGRAVAKYAKGAMVKARRKKLLADYYIAFSAIDGKAVIILSTRPLALPWDDGQEGK